MSTDGRQDRNDAFRPDERLDDELQRELDDALGDVNLEELLSASQAEHPDAGAEGATAEGVQRGAVVAVHGDDIFVDLGGKRQGLLPAAQFEDEPLPEPGDEIEFTIEGFDHADGLLLLSRKGAVLAATWETLEEGQIVEARVTGHNKGGLELTVGGVRAFMPISQIEMFHVEELGDYVNRKLACQVVEIDRREQNVILSRRAVLELEAERKAQQLWETLAEGQVLRGVVKTIMPYGAFVDIGGADGLLHVSDMSHARVEDPRHIVTEGQAIDVKVLKIDTQERRISLGLKQTMPDPWDGVAGKWREGNITTGRVVRLADFGAFVELEPGVEGLVPISEMSYARRVHHPGEVLAEGDTVKLKVLKVDAEARRISLSVKQVEDDPWTGASVRWPAESIVQGRVTRVVDFGAFVELTAGVEGLVHISELSGDFVRSADQAVQEGQMVRAKVLDVDEEARRISLSIAQAAHSPEAADPAEVQPQPPRPERKGKKPLKGGLD